MSLAAHAACFLVSRSTKKFEHAIVLVLTLLIVLIVTSATWHLMLAVFGLVIADQIDPANQQVFQAVFGMIFTVMIALEFKHSLLIVLAKQESVVRVRSIVLIALLAVARKFIILDLREGSVGRVVRSGRGNSRPGFGLLACS